MPTIAFCFLILLSNVSAARPQDPVVGLGTLESRLAVTSGQGRLTLLVRLMSGYRETDWARVLVYGTEALALAEKTLDPQQELEILNALCLASYRREKHESALTYGKRAEKLARQLGETSELAFALTYMGEASRRLGRHRQALESSLEARGLYEEIGDSAGLGKALNGVGYAYWRMGEYPEAMASYFQAHDVFEAAGHRRGVGQSLRNVGIVHLDMEQVDKALEFFERALEIQQEENNDREIAALLSEFGKAYIQKGELNRALEYLLSSLKIWESLGHRTSIAVVLGFIGNAYFEMNDLEHAMEYHEQALDLRRDIGDRARQASSLIKVAAIERRKGDHGSAIERLQECLTIASEIRAQPVVQAAFQGLSESYSALGRHREALAAYKRYDEVKSEIFNEESKRRVAEILARHQADKLEEEIERLRQRQALDALVIDRQRAIRTALTVSLALLAFVIAVKTRAARQIAQRNEQLLVALEKLAESEEHHRHLEEQRLRDTVRSAMAELPLERIDVRDAELGMALDEPLAATPSAAPEWAELVFPEGYLPGPSAAMQETYQTMRSLLRSDMTVLIEGETGVGKEGIARILHMSSCRRDAPFVAVNCAAIPGEMLEAEMFGIGHGVATGVNRRSGKFRAAEGGTLFLDEVGEMPLPLQAKLLRAVQEKKIQPVGGKERAVDVWIVAAANRNLLSLAEDGKFRSDLYYRLAGHVLHVPPLRERHDDLVPLLEHFLSQAASVEGKRIRGLTVKALDVLRAYGWPGNVRELEHEVKRLARQVADGQMIDSAMLSEHILGRGPNGSGQRPSSVHPAVERPPAIPGEARGWHLKSHVHEAERQAILQVLTQVGWSRRQAAVLLGISRSTLARKISDLGISPEAPNRQIARGPIHEITET